MPWRLRFTLAKNQSPFPMTSSEISSARTLRHLELVGASLFLGIIAGIPLGIGASRPGPVSNFILATSGVIQTIPSLALLALLVPLPFFGISPVTAIFALFLYSLLPIVRNTATGLQDIPMAVRESAAALGLEPHAQLWKVFLPLASRTILAGVKTSAMITVGTATLAALIGVGGLGEPIISGLNLNDYNTILQAAIPAALLALLVQFFFDGLDRVFVPKVCGSNNEKLLTPMTCPVAHHSSVPRGCSKRFAVRWQSVGRRNGNTACVR